MNWFCSKQGWGFSADEVSLREGIESFAGGDDVEDSTH